MNRNLRKRLCLWLFVCAAGYAAFARVAAGALHEWPAYGADAARSSYTAEVLDFPLAVSWSYDIGSPPSPAWPEPGQELHRLDFDYAFQPVIAGGRVYFGSSADDALWVLDLATGDLQWQFVTGAPIRFAPAVLDGRVYLVSDDGWLYCLQAEDGKVLWKFQGAPSDDLMIGNGRMISRWPMRSGVLAEDGIIYTAAGMWASGGVYLYALKADTGKVIWQNDSSGEMFLEHGHPDAFGFGGVSPQGYLLATEDMLLVPTGRSVPAAFDKATGELIYYRPAYSQYSGGSWVTVIDDFFFNQAHARLIRKPPPPGYRRCQTG